MSMSPRRTIPVCALNASENLDSLVDAVRRLGGWDVVPICASDHEQLRAVRDSAVGYIMLASPGEDLSALQEELARRSENTPLIVVGDDPSPSARPSSWLRTLPPPEVLGALLGQSVSSPPSSGPRRPQSGVLPSPVSWRRKTDMIIGTSPAIRQLVQSLDRISASSAPVMITGESGTGKELVARAVHFCGPRANAPFIAINCAAIPDTLFEAELFGYTRGAFTGATSARAGAFESATTGTLFLDEIGDLPLPMQPKLLRVLETGEVVRLGSTDPIRVAVRCVAATNRNLEEEVAKGRFREDLYYRLRVFSLIVPPLRARPDDIPAIVNHHLSLIAARENQPTPRLTPAALAKLVRHYWRGNVRELINTLERAFVLGNPIDVDHIELPASGMMPAVGRVAPYRDAKALFEAEYYAQLMRIAGGNVTFAAKLSKKTRKEVYDALKRLGLEASAYRATGIPEADGASIVPEEP
jgi:two-component system response regulator GlrR